MFQNKPKNFLNLEGQNLALIDAMESIPPQTNNSESFEFKNCFMADVDSHETAITSAPSNDFAKLQPAQALALLYSTELKVEAVAIGYTVDPSSVPGQRLQLSQLYLRITEILKADGEILDSFEEPMQVGGFFAWEKSNVTINLGSSEEAMKRRLPNFLCYLRNRRKQQSQYEKKTKAEQ